MILKVGVVTDRHSETSNLTRGFGDTCSKGDEGRQGGGGTYKKQAYSM